MTRAAAVIALVCVTRTAAAQTPAPVPPATPPPATSAPAASAPAVAPPPTSPPTPAPTGQPGESLTPFGIGVPIQITSSGEPVTVFVVRAQPGAPRPDDADFVKVGHSPITLQLPNGSYLVETEGFDSTRGAFELGVDGQARQLLVKNGSQSTHTLGTFTTAVGIAAALAGIVALVGGATSQSSSLRKPAVLVPLFSSGGVLLATGITLTVVSRTSIEDTSPGRSKDGRPLRAPTTARVDLSWAF